jgi:hypothetical protein
MALLLSLAAPPLRADEESAAEATGPPSLAAALVETPPVIDGVLDDSCWQQAARFDSFWREYVDGPELQRTEAWICSDERAIYVAFRAHDTDPSAIAGRQKKRQGSMQRDDWVQVCLDVEDAGRNQYRFRVNAAGVQWDEVPGGTNEKIEWKGDWRAASRLDEQGWTAEIEIPFAILRYPEGQECFRFYLERHLGREQDSCIWPKCYAQVKDPDYCARLAELSTPPVRLRYVIMPYALSVLSEHEAERESPTAGLDLKGSWPNGVVGLATLNPDFSNIEDVVETIDFTFVERYLPEYRPFFQEGSGYMPYQGGKWSRGPVNLFYSRRIGEIDWGAKTFGTVGPHRFGILDAYRSGGENHLVWNYERLFGTEGNLSLSGVDRRLPGEPDNRALGVGSRWSLPFPGGLRTFSADWYQSSTQGAGGDDHAVKLSASLWRDQGFSVWAGYSDVGDEFRADDGYVPETGIHAADIGVGHVLSHEGGNLLLTEWYGTAAEGESAQGSRRSVALDHGLMYRNGWSIWASANRGERDGFDVATNGLTLGWNWQDVYRSGGIGITWGERFGERYRYQSVSQAFRLNQRWSAKLTAERVFAAWLDFEGNVIPPDWYRQVVLTSAYDVSDERTISARLVRSASDTNVYAAYRQRLRRGADLLVVVGDPNAPEWVSRVAVKAIWCF